MVTKKKPKKKPLFKGSVQPEPLHSYTVRIAGVRARSEDEARYRVWNVLCPAADGWHAGDVTRERKR